MGKGKQKKGRQKCMNMNSPLLFSSHARSSSLEKSWRDFQLETPLHVHATINTNDTITPKWSMARRESCILIPYVSMADKREYTV
jgi:hypothetical protein